MTFQDLTVASHCDADSRFDLEFGPDLGNWPFHI